MIVSILQLMGFPFGTRASGGGGENPNSRRAEGDNQGITRSHEGDRSPKKRQSTDARQEHAGATAARRQDVKPQSKAVKPTVKAKPAAKAAKPAAKKAAPAKKAAVKAAPAKKVTVTKTPAKATKPAVKKPAAPAKAAKPAAKAAVAMTASPIQQGKMKRIRIPRSLRRIKVL